MDSLTIAEHSGLTVHSYVALRCRLYKVEFSSVQSVTHSLTLTSGGGAAAGGPGAGPDRVGQGNGGGEG